MNPRLIAVVALGLLALGACGKRGTLERPPAPANRGEVRDPAQENRTMREAPLGGAPQDPRAGPGSDPR